MDSPGGPGIIERVLKSGRGNLKSVKVRGECEGKSERCTLLILDIEEGNMSQGVPRAWKLEKTRRQNLS